MDGTTWRDEGTLWSISYEGEARQLAKRATRFGYSLKDERRVGLVDIGGDWRGTLMLTDSVTQEALRIDDGVFASGGQLAPSYVAPAVFGDDVVVYSVPQGERVGVWIARLPAAPSSS